MSPSASAKWNLRRFDLCTDDKSNGDSIFDTIKKGNGPGHSYTTTDNAGGSCEQIIAAQGLGKGHTKHGCSISARDEWVALVGAYWEDDTTNGARRVVVHWRWTWRQITNIRWRITLIS